MPGGKMEQGESIKESVTREYREETGLHLTEPQLAGSFTFTIFNDDDLVQEWMMFTFICKEFEGKLAEYCSEGELEWVAIDDVKDLPMAEGDRKIFEHVLSSDAMLFGSFAYTEDYNLIDLRLDPSRA